MADADANGNDHVWTRLEYKREPPDALPLRIRVLLEKFPMLSGEGQAEIEALENYTCVICGSELGEETALLLSEGGLLAVVCQTSCFDSAIILAYLHGQMQRVHESIRMDHESP